MSARSDASRHPTPTFRQGIVGRGSIAVLAGVGGLLCLSASCGGAASSAATVATPVEEQLPEPPANTRSSGEREPFTAAGALPDDSVAVAHLDLHALRASAHWARVYGWFEAMLRPGSPTLQGNDQNPRETFGVDLDALLRSADEAWVAVRPQFDPDALDSEAPDPNAEAMPCAPGLLVALRGAALNQMDPQQVTRAVPLQAALNEPPEQSAQTVDDVVRAGVASPLTVAVLEDHWLLGCAIEAQLAASRGMQGQPLEQRRPELQPLVSRARQGVAPFSFWVTEQREALDALARLLTIEDPAVRQEVQDGALWLDASADVVVEGTVTFVNSQTATTLVAEMESKRQALLNQPFLRLFGLLPVVQAIRIKSEGLLLTTRLHMQEQAFRELLDRLEAFVQLLQEEGAAGFNPKHGQTS